jgi:sugar O-acyltransferase (sialic acid O-acetyltransferase NeuD family)
MPVPVILPLVNPNEPEALLAELNVQEGQSVHAGELICSLETTKSTAEVTAESSGYIAGLRFRQGDTVRAGEILCYLADSPDWTPELPAPASGEEAASEGQAEGAPVPEGLRITQPALNLAHSLGLSLESLPQGILVTESALRSLLKTGKPAEGLPVPAAPFEPGAVILYGAGGHGKMLIDLLRAQGHYQIYGIVDDSLTPGAQVMGVQVAGGAGLLPALYAQGVRLAVNAVGGISSIAVRVEIFRRLAEAGFAFPALAHPRALVEPGARLAAGSQVLAMAYVGSEAQIGFGTIVNTGAIVSHDCRLGDYVAISPGAILAGEVQVGSRALIGMGATINLRVKIGAGARIGNGATVKADVPEKGVVRAGTAWPYPD